MLIWNDLNALLSKNTAIPYNDPSQNIAADRFLHLKKLDQVLPAPELVTDHSTFNLRAGMLIGSDLLLVDYFNRVLKMDNYQAGDKLFHHNLTQDNITDTYSGTSAYRTRSILSAKHMPQFNQTFLVDEHNDRILIYNGGISNASSVHVLGQNSLTNGINYINNTTNRTSRFPSPIDVCRTNDYIFVSDAQNHRVIAFSSNINVDDTDPLNPLFSNSILFAVGQPDTASNLLRAPSKKDLNRPAGLWCDESRLVIADQMNNRILEFSPLPQSNYPEASRVIGQSDFFSKDETKFIYRPRYLDSNGVNLLVSLPEHHKVLYWNKWPDENLADAHYIFGQKNPENILPYCGEVAQTTDIFCFHTPLQISQNSESIFIADAMAGRLLIFPQFK